VLLRRKVRIILTHERTVSLRSTDARSATWCPRCGAFVTMLTPEEAALVAGVKTRHIFRWLESERLHFVETANLSPLVCLESLPTTAAGQGGVADFDTDAPEAAGNRLKLSKEGEAR
jgi:hypothetical protein